MSESKINIDLLSFRGIASRLPSLKNVSFWRVGNRDKSSLLANGSPESLFETSLLEEENSDTSSFKILQASLLGLKDSISKLSSSLSLNRSNLSGNSYDGNKRGEVLGNNAYRVERLVSGTTTEINKDSISLSEIEKSIEREASTQRLIEKLSFVNFSGKSGRDTSGILNSNSGIRNYQYTFSGNLSSLKTDQVTSVYTKNHQTGNQEESIYNLNYLASVIQSSKDNKEKLVDQEVRKSSLFDSNKAAEKPSYSVHQTFGDIIVHPTNLDVSMQQLKVKIHDILKQARDTIY